MPSIRTFGLRTIETGLLRAFFKRHGVEIGREQLAAEVDAKTLATAVMQELRLRGPNAADAIADDLARIEKLASEFGEAALDEKTQTEDLAELPSRYARALHVFLYDEAGFRRAEEMVFNDQRRGGKQWNAFAAAQNLELSRDEAAVERLKDAMRLQFNTPNVHLEIFDRVRSQLPDSDDEGSASSELVQITIYRESKPNSEYKFIGGALGTEVRHPVLEASVTYEPKTGMIECVAPYRDDRNDIARLLAINLLGCSPDFTPMVARAFDLTVLQQRRAFETEPLDLIESVAVSMLRLIPLERSGEIITVENTRKSDRDIWAVVEERLGSQALHSDYSIHQATVVIRYRSETANSARSLAVTITHPNRSNLKERTEIERAVANKYLPRWGLVAA